MEENKIQKYARNSLYYIVAIMWFTPFLFIAFKDIKVLGIIAIIDALIVLPLIIYGLKKSMLLMLSFIAHPGLLPIAAGLGLLGFYPTITTILVISLFIIHLIFLVIGLNRMKKE